MLDWLSKEFLLAAIISLTVALLVVLTLGGPPTPPGEPQQQTHSDHGSSNQQPNNTASSDKLTVGILVANFLLVFAVLGQIREARLSSERQLRAYLTSVVGTGFRQGETRGLRFEFRPVILNTGQTPAYEVYSVTGLRFLSLQEAMTFDFRLPEAAGTTHWPRSPARSRPRLGYPAAPPSAPRWLPQGRVVYPP